MSRNVHCSIGMPTLKFMLLDAQFSTLVHCFQTLMPDIGFFSQKLSIQLTSLAQDLFQPTYLQSQKCDVSKTLI